MDTGIIAKRYARAIYLFAADRGDETRLREEMKALSVQFIAVPALKKVLDDPTVPAFEKVSALITAVDNGISDTCKRVLEMVIGNGRAHYMQNIALMYDQVYRKEKNIVVIKLTTIEPASPEMKDALIDLIVKDKNDQVDFAATTNPAIIGGFVLAVEDSRLDASVKNQLSRIKLELLKH
jgi:F-type H+-transporting ATPase subunit delta